MKKLIVVMLALALVITDAIGGMTAIAPANATEATPAITLSGSVAEGDNGFLNSKAVVLSAGEETRVNYRLVPSYGAGTKTGATGVQVTIYLPSLAYANGEYRVVDRTDPATPLGVQGRVSAGGGWNVLSDTTEQGGPIVMEYEGRLGAGNSPAFDIYLTTYNDGSDGPYGGVPEGTAFEINGSVSYESFEDVLGTSWSTPNALDDESRVSVISSDLKWDARLESYVPDGEPDLVPIWDRYQYIDYLYTIKNTSTNVAANVDGYSVTFDIDSTASSVNGIIPFDINRWSYRADGEPEANPDLDNTSGQFVGVPGQGGILIYDVTDWDRVSELTDEIPYTYSGTGMIEIDRQTGANQQQLTPAQAAGATERQYMISLPLSRQGFPNPPTMFDISTITDVLFARSAHWTKTFVTEREIVEPSYAFDYTHTAQQPEAVFGLETFTEMRDFVNNADAPAFDVALGYRIDDDFVIDRLMAQFDPATAPEFAEAALTYSFVDAETGESVTERLLGEPGEPDPETGWITLAYDLTALKELDWDRTFALSLADQMAPGATLPLVVKVYGTPERVGEMTGESTVTVIEKFASNDDFGQNTTYTEVEHPFVAEAPFDVIYPDEVVPSIAFDIAGQGEEAILDWGSRASIDVMFGVNGTVAENSTTTLVLNAEHEGLTDIEATLRAALFAQASNVRVSYETLDGQTGTLDVAVDANTGEAVVALPARVARLFIDTDALTSDGAVPFVTLTATVDESREKTHVIEGELRTYQPKPYDVDAVSAATGTIEIALPNELKPTVGVVGVYGSARSTGSTSVGYESTFGVEYQLDTRGVTSPSSDSVIELLKPTKKGELEFRGFALQDAFLNVVTSYTVTLVDPSGAEQTFAQPVIAADEVTLDSVAQIIVSSTDLQLSGAQAIAMVDLYAQIEIGSSQVVRGTFTGTQNAPYDESATAADENRIEVRETQTAVQIEGVNQVNKGLGVGNEYSVDIYRWWNRGYTYNTQDFTLDQGYKSLGGFTATMTRPTEAPGNNDQTISLDVELPHEQFDLYYLKIRDDLRPYIDTVDVYRTVDGEEVLWKSVPGSSWVDNTQEAAGFWRIATARAGTDDAGLFTTYDSVAGVTEHPYYKDAWDADVRPEAPVSRVDVTLQFTRENNDALPQLGGRQNNAIEYMGRFHSTSTGGKQPTVLTSTDTFGTQLPLTRAASHEVKSLVSYPYAQTKTGANDTTSLANKVIPMGSVGEYLASIWNVNSASWPYYNGHGPDIYSPAATEYDEWLGMYDPASFHDELVYEFTYPANPRKNAVYNLDATHVTIPATSALQYLTEIRVTDSEGDTVSHQLTSPLAAEARFDYDHTQPRGIHDDGDGTFTISFGDTGLYPDTFEAVFSEVAGFGDRTAEIDGVAAETLGTSLNEVDVRIGGVVNGNQALTGTTKLYRIPADSQQKMLMHTSSATLTGYTPKLGARLDMTFDRIKVYDYNADGTTPQTTRVAVGVQNSSEADIKDVAITVTPDAAYRTQTVGIPVDIFTGDWNVSSVTVKQGSTSVELPLDEFVLNDATGDMEFDLRALFADGTFATVESTVSRGGSATLLKQQIDTVRVVFAPRDATVGLWGSFTRDASETELPLRMREGGSVFLTGVWVDAAKDGEPWNSKPSFAGENAKASNESIQYNSTFAATAEVSSYQTITTTAGGGNNGIKPALSLAWNTGAPRLYNRVARLQTSAIHLQNDRSRAGGSQLFYDADTGTQVDAGNIAVGDTAKVLYELRNIGTTATDDRGQGSLPVFAPIAHIEAPTGLRITSVEAVSAELADPAIAGVIAETSSQVLDVDTGNVTVTTKNTQRSDVAFAHTLHDGDSVFFFVEYTAVNNYGTQLGDTQNKTLQWTVSSRPAYTHHFQSYDSTGASGNRVTGSVVAVNYDGDALAESLGRVTNTAYRYANPNQLVIDSQFDVENVSGETMTLAVRNIRNEILHDNTRMDLEITLDEMATFAGFELTELVTPRYPDGYVGEYDAPQTSYRVPQMVAGKLAPTWVTTADLEAQIAAGTAALRDVTAIRVAYGSVPAQLEGATFEAPAFDLHGIGHWRAELGQTAKYYDLTSQAAITLTHRDASSTDVAAYSFTTNSTKRVYKAIPQIEFNVQSFDTIDAARQPYSGADLGKTGYRPGDAFGVKITAKNHTTFQGTGTNTPYGKGPLLTPEITDRIPEYLDVPLLKFASDGTLDVAAAVAAGKLEVRLTDAAGVSRAAEPTELPTATVVTEQGLDIAGDQVFADNRRNDGWGLLASTEPIDTSTNLAAKIDFSVVSYVFEAPLARGAQIELMYPAEARTADLPVATYANGASVFAPFFGWYGSNRPVANSAGAVDMDMASLLHDAGISGDRGHEMTSTEFLSNSSSWQPGTNAQRRTPNGSSTTQTTFYDESADTSKTHTAHLKETANEKLYTTFTSTTLDENFRFAAEGRVPAYVAGAGHERTLWAQDGMQLRRAWLYGASEMLPDTQRAVWGPDAANFFEHDGSLNSSNRHLLGITPAVDDDYTYAVQLHEEFTVRLHAANLGDHPVEEGLEYLETLPIGITPYAGDGVSLLGVTAFDGAGAELASSVDIVQSPENDQGYRAPAQPQEAGTYAETTRDDGVPYVVRVRVASPLTGMFNSAGAAVTAKDQRVDIRVRVESEVPPSADNISYWHDAFTLTTIEPEPAVEIYSAAYGAFNVTPTTTNRAKFPNDGMTQGIEVNDLLYTWGSYSSYYAAEPWGRYVRGLNAQTTATTAGDGRPALVTGDQIAMRKPTLRVWSAPQKDAYTGVADTSVEDFSVDLYEEFTIHSTVENQQLEVLGEYNRVSSGYNQNSSRVFNVDVWENTPQTIGGARGSWFEPTVTIALPYGVAPVMQDGSYGRYYADAAAQQQVAFTATLNDITFDSSAAVADLTDVFDVEVETVTDKAGQRFVLHFSVNADRAADVAYGQSLIISPRVVTIDTPAYGLDTDDSRYQEVLAFAETLRPVFNPIVSALYPTGSLTSLSTRDQGVSVAPNNVKSSNGKSITENDRTRRDSTSSWSANMGALKITEPLISETRRFTDATSISLNSNVAWTLPGSTFVSDRATSAHEKSGAYGGTIINLRKPSITNSTGVTADANLPASELIQVDAAGTYWVATEVANGVTEHVNPHEQIKTAGDVHNSRFRVTQHVTNFAEATGDTRIRVGDEVYDRMAYEALGYRVERSTPTITEVDEARNRIEWIVTPPANARGTGGELKSGEQFTLLFEAQLVDGYADSDVTEADVWQSDDLIVDSYVSLITDDTSLIPVGGAQRAEDFIVQSPRSMTYHTHITDFGADFDLDGNGDATDGIYATDQAEIEILKPRAEVRVNTTRPRIPYSNGRSGDTYFNSSDTIEYLVTHAAITGSGLKEFVVENVLPTNETHDSSVSVSNQEISTSSRYVTSGSWQLPEATLERLALAGVETDDAFRSYVYISHELAEDGYEAGDWTLLNPGGTSILDNAEFEIAEGDRAELQKVRVVVRALQPSRFLVPRGFSLAVDADPATEGVQSVLETDPDNHSTFSYPASVTDAAIRFGLRSSSDARSTLFIYDSAQAWGNYVASNVSKLAQSNSRSYLTPSRPVVNVKFDARYYRSDGTQPTEQRFGWSDIMAIAPKVSAHLKFSGEFINADATMWSEEESNTYVADTLVDPFVTFQLPTVLEAGGEYTYVPTSEVTSVHPLSAEHRSRFALTSDATNLWTWKVVRADGSVAPDNGGLKQVDLRAGAWQGLNRNMLSIWFEGSLEPGEKIVVDFIGAVDDYSPGKDAEDLKSRAMISNNTGLLYPLNSQQNAGNRLGYSTDANDLTQNGQTTDRLVFSEKTLFEYETYDNFSKRKVAYSDLNRAGTVAPEATPVREGGDVSFKVSIDNPRAAGDRAYPYPIIYDVLPHLGDTSITSPNIARGSQYAAWLQPGSVKLEREGTDAKTYSADEYTVYVGPLTRQNGEIVAADMVSHEDAASTAFYSALGDPGQASAVRDRSFVPLAEVQGDPELLKLAKTVLVLLNDPNAQLPGQSKLTLSYAMQTPLNAPTYLEQFNDETRKQEVLLWNSFMATQRTNDPPSESNSAGAFVTEQRDRVYLGNYVWNDVNANGAADEGETFTDDNGRELLRPSRDLNFDGEIDDPGINGARATLLTPEGNYVDTEGQPIHQVANAWEVVDEATGDSVLDDVFGLPIVSEGPVVTTTQTDFHGNAGYYAFSNVQPGDYRVMLEFPSEYDRFAVTTTEVFEGAAVEMYQPGEALDIPAEVDDAALVAITAAAWIDADTTDAQRMSFDVGVSQQVRVGGAVFQEQLATLDGYRQPATEAGLAGYEVTMHRMNGDVAVDAFGAPFITMTDAQGTYAFDVVASEEDYTISISDVDDRYGPEMMVSPFVHHADPFTAADDNDGFSAKGARTVTTNPFSLGIASLVATGFADRDSVSIGMYERSTAGVIGNRVWHDLDRDGLHGASEPGIAGQALTLRQYARVDDRWETTEVTQQTVSNADGYYYFTEVPSKVTVDGAEVEARYQVIVTDLVAGYTFTSTHQRAAAGVSSSDVDSDFYPNGTMHETAVVGEHLIAVSEVDAETGLVTGIDDNSVDLGLVTHARSSLSGEVFTDLDRDGVDAEDTETAPVYTAALQVLVDGAWVPVRVDADGSMIEPRDAQEADAQAVVTAVNAYEFEALHIIDSVILAPYEYRVRITEIPRWQDVTALRAGDDPRVDNDFTQVEEERGLTHVAVSESRVLGARTTGTVLPVDTFAGAPATHVDLGVIEFATQGTIGDRLWEDRDGDGRQGTREPGIPDTRVVLNRVVDGALVPVDETRTDADGAYTFSTDVAGTDPSTPQFHVPHTYVVEFVLTSRQSLAPTEAEGAATESVFVPLEVGGGARYAHQIADPRHTAVSSAFTLVDADANGWAQYAGTADTDAVDGGVIVHDTVRAIGDTVYEDVDRDGVQTGDEPGLAGLTVRLFKFDLGTGTWAPHEDLDGVSALETDADGGYQFTVEVADLEKASPTYRSAEQYRVLIEAPAHLRLVELGTPFGYGRAAEAPGADVAKPTSFVLSDAISLVDAGDGGVELTSAHDVLTADAGFAVYADAVTVGGVVWEDADRDGVRVEDEIVIAGQTVRLWELIDGVWTQVEDLDGHEIVETDDEGAYAFRVSPTHYDELAPGFLTPREYRVTTERLGSQTWSPLRAGDDSLLDSDVEAAGPEFGGVHTGVTGVFSVADLVGGDIDGTVDSELGAIVDGTVDVTSVRDDLQMSIGVTSFDELVTIGGIAWVDADEDGVRQSDETLLDGRDATLWERIDGTWQVATDADGIATQRTDDEGAYRFLVAPTEYDADADGYLLPREYRVTLEIPEGSQLSRAATATVLEATSVVTLNAQIAELVEAGGGENGAGDNGDGENADGVIAEADAAQVAEEGDPSEAGVIDISRTHDDTTLDFAFVEIPAASGLAITGARFGALAGAGVLALLLGGVGIWLGARRRREAREGLAV